MARSFVTPAQRKRRIFRDILLLAGKGHEDYQVLAERTVYFDERQIVQEGYAVLQSAQREGKNDGRILQKKDFI